MNPNDLLWLIPALPLLGAIINGLLALGAAKSPLGASRGLSGFVAVAMPAISFVLSIWLARNLPVAVSASGDEIARAAAFTQHLWAWLPIGQGGLSFGLMFDSLTALMLAFVTGIGTLIHLYSVGYMKDDRGFARFMAYMNLFMFSMIILVMGASLPVTFLGWEGVGLCSYLLIGFWHRTEAYNDAARKAFVMNRVGDLGFLLGAFALYSVVGSMDYQLIRDFFQNPANAGVIAASTGTLAVAALLIFLGCTGKSAQIPLLGWLPDAMAGPTPVSALIHAATMVTSGVYLVARLSDFFVVPGMSLHVNLLFTAFDLHPLTLILITGCATALWGAIAGIFQNDIKKALAYSTVSQLGFMFMAVGVGAFDVALFHVFTHAFFKATLFLGAGAVIHGLHHEQDMRRMGGLTKLLPVAHLAMCYGWFAIVGGPGSSGFMSKDLVLERLLYVHGHEGIMAHVHLVIFVIAAATALITVFYMTRVMMLTFWSPSRVTPAVKAHVHGTPLTMAIPLLMLAFGSLMVGCLWTEHVSTMKVVLFKDWLGPVLFSAQQQTGSADLGKGHGSGPLWMGFAVFALSVLVGLFTFAKYRRGPTGATVDQVPDSAPTGFGARWTFFFDRLWNAVVVAPVKVLGLALYWLVELLAIGLVTQLVVATANVLGDGYAAVQRARLRSNLALAAAGLVAVVVFLLMAAKG